MLHICYKNPKNVLHNVVKGYNIVIVGVVFSDNPPKTNK